MRERQQLDGALSGFTRLLRELDDNIELVSLGEEEGDEGVVSEAESALKKLRAASIDEIAALPGFGQRTATAISEALEKSRRTTTPAVNMTTGEILDDDDESVAAVPAGPTRTEH